MKKSHRFQSIKRINDSKQHQIEQIVNEFQQKFTASQQRLDELNKYRQDYIHSFFASGASGMAIGQMHSFRTFLSKLDQVIDIQKSNVQDDCRKLEEKKQLLVTQYKKNSVVENVLAQTKQEELRIEGNAEQKLMDEHASQSYEKSKSKSFSS